MWCQPFHVEGDVCCWRYAPKDNCQMSQNHLVGVDYGAPRETSQFNTNIEGRQTALWFSASLLSQRYVI